MVVPLVIGGIAAAVIGVGGGVWYLWRRARSGRIGLEREEIEEDIELLRDDREIRRTEKEEKYQSEYLKDLLYAAHKRAIQLGLDGYEKRNILVLDYISRGLGLLIKENISVLQEYDLIKKINESINRYLNNFPQIQDQKINNYILEIRTMQARLESYIKKEDVLLSQEEESLRKKYSEIQKERGA